MSRKLSWLKSIALAVSLWVAIACQPARSPQSQPVVAPSPTITALPQVKSRSNPPQDNPQLPDDALVDIQTVSPAIELDMRYATTNNFMKRKLYPVSRCILRSAVAKQLAKVQLELESQGLGLKVYDCYRPLSVQRQMWQVVPDEHYVANPAKGSRHNRASAVDLTLVDRNGKELEMPTEFDDFTTKAHRDDLTASPLARQHSQLLATVMVKHGFIPLPTEWWHFDAVGWQHFPVMDVPLQSI
ncbi:M15 family metallopeptidase [Pseudanabaena sp. PCC 6802]|uniref:M15 family metallopeptidase n=1 Tax=Pseudanabaena sp. PCC 6802 TaxID=118173 RepID=UPI0012EA038E|nr:M15 family metallopeptidase [Pseudanabaena sp. PCC 6802]